MRSCGATAAAASFQKEHPEIRITLVARGSLELAQAIVDGKEQPTLVSPADSLVQNLLAADYRDKYGRDLFATSGEDAPHPLLLTPLVFVAWEDRGEALLRASGGAISWKTIHRAVSSNEGWPAIDGKKEWGFVKLGHANPTSTNSGLQALLSMSLEYHAKPKGLEVGDLLKPKYQAFIKEIEKGVPRFEASTTAFMTDMIRFGPSKYDLAVIYESLAIAELDKARGRWQRLLIYYPATTLWSDHPVAVVQAPWVTEPQQKAARAFVAYLRSAKIQELALGFGFRPADTSIPLRTADPKNPFVRLADRGLKVVVPPMAPAPDAQVIRNLLLMWSRTVGK